MFPSLIKVRNSPQVPESIGININSSDNFIFEDSYVLPIYGVLRTNRENVNELIESMILVICYGDRHIPYTNHIFKDIIICEDDIASFEEDVCFYFNINGIEACKLEAKPGIFYLMVSTCTIQSNNVKVTINK